MLAILGSMRAVRLPSLLLALALGCAQAAFAQVDERVIYASVVDSKGQPVLDVGPKDLVVSEDGQTREILRIAKDDDPLQIALLVDNSVSMRGKLSDLRKALSTFVTGLRPGVQVALITLAERPTIVVNYTADQAALLKGVGGIVLPVAGTYVLDGIAEASEVLTKRPMARPVMVVVTGRGPELSHRDYTDVLRPLRVSGAALHAVIVTGPNPEGDAMRGARAGNSADAGGDIADAGGDIGDAGDASGGVGRDILLGRMTKETGGRYQEVLSTSGLNAKLQQLSSEISNQYRVTFARPQRLIPPKSTKISARQSKMRVRGMLMKTDK
jgi:VWFA-related protein